MNDAASGSGSFIRQRRAGMAAIAASLPVALLLWLAIAYLMPPLTGMDSLGDRMLLTLKCCCLAVLFCLVTGVEAVAHERLFSPAFDPLAGFETRRLRVNQRYLQNTTEQFLVFVAGLFGLAAYSPDGSAMRAVLATTTVWIMARFAFWVGYHRGAAMRGLVPRVTHIVGYSRFSLTRASAVVNCQSAFAWCLLRLSCHAATSSIKVCLLAMRRSRH
jgi:hypothetical protein